MRHIKDKFCTGMAFAIAAIVFITVLSIILFSCDNSDFAVGNYEECTPENTELHYCTHNSRIEGLWQVTRIFQRICESDTCEVQIFTPSKLYHTNHNVWVSTPCTFTGYFSFTPLSNPGEPEEGAMNALTTYQIQSEKETKFNHRIRSGSYVLDKDHLNLYLSSNLHETYNIEFLTKNYLILHLKTETKTIKTIFLQKTGEVGHCFQSSFFGNCFYYGPEDKIFLLNSCIQQKSCFDLLDFLELQGNWKPIES